MGEFTSGLGGLAQMLNQAAAFSGSRGLPFLPVYTAVDTVGVDCRITVRYDGDEHMAIINSGEVDTAVADIAVLPEIYQFGQDLLDKLRAWRPI